MCITTFLWEKITNCNRQCHTAMIDSLTEHMLKISQQIKLTYKLMICMQKKTYTFINAFSFFLSNEVVREVCQCFHLQEISYIHTTLSHINTSKLESLLVYRESYADMDV